MLVGALHPNLFCTDSKQILDPAQLVINYLPLHVRKGFSNRPVFSCLEEHTITQIST